MMLLVMRASMTVTSLALGRPADYTAGCLSHPPPPGPLASLVHQNKNFLPIPQASKISATLPHLLPSLCTYSFPDTRQLFRPMALHVLPQIFFASHLAPPKAPLFLVHSRYIYSCLPVSLHLHDTRPAHSYPVSPTPRSVLVSPAENTQSVQGHHMMLFTFLACYLLAYGTPFFIDPDSVLPFPPLLARFYYPS